MCFILLLFCVIGISNGPEKFTVFYENDVQKRAIELGYTTKKDIKNQTIISVMVIYLPCFLLIPIMLYYLNDARIFNDFFFGSLIIMYIMGIFDRLFIDLYWVEHTKAWLIPKTEDLRPYITLKVKLIKWIGTIIGFPIISLIISLVMILII